MAASPAVAAPFSFETVRAAARDLAARPYRAPADDLPAGLRGLKYDAYRDIRFTPARAFWADTDSPFQLQMFHRGGMFPQPVELHEVVAGNARPIAYDPTRFTFGRVAPGRLRPTLGYAGFRIHTPMAVAGRFDELAVFLGASYFRAVSHRTAYGLSARGLALGAGEPAEEFPRFRTFWIERPAAGARSIVLHALLDSPSVAGAYRFVITPGEPTQFDIVARLFPRRDLTNAGLAPLTSMFLFGLDGGAKFDDFRMRVHDSDGLLIGNGAGERLWRPLANPANAAGVGPVQASAFSDDRPKGFGLLQRDRAFANYQDLEAHYERRPSAWVEALEGFGSGDVRLSELPTREEVDDNIVACWRPGQPLRAGAEHRLAYRLRWGLAPEPADPRAAVAYAASGHGDRPGARRFVVDFAPLKAETGRLRADVVASKGRLREIIVQPNGALGGARLSFLLDPGDSPVCELRAALFYGDRPISEVWTHRWLA